jgi:hypothetical protein
MRPATSGDLIIFMKFLPHLFGLDSTFFGGGAIATRALTALCKMSRCPECGGSLDTHLLAEALVEDRLLIVAATCQAFPAACMAKIESLDEISTDCGMVRMTLGLSDPGTHRRVCRRAVGACGNDSTCE